MHPAMNSFQDNLRIPENVSILIDTHCNTEMNLSARDMENKDNNKWQTD